jgi:hypothetical protein
MPKTSMISVVMGAKDTFHSSWAIFQSRPSWPFRSFKLFTSHTSICREPFFTVAIYSRGGVNCFLPLIATLALYNAFALLR